ncbi:MAG: biotin--[acetyl-CoA-carboxylase] ligase [Chloroflexi bacterium]|nr:biotin--[acetyl-CoA-carboxylase] ligase [Chloroflexota bacterium]
MEDLASRLAGLPLGGLRYFERVGSTNDLAMDWIREGAPDFALVVSDEQTAGRGRFARKWITRPGAALAFSLVVLPTQAEAEQMPSFSAWGALALCQTLDSYAGMDGKKRPLIKWPNDLLLQGRKAAGLLVEAAWLGSQIQGAVIGIGVNVTPGSVPPDEELLYPATCIETAFGSPLDRWELLRKILAAMLELRPRLGTEAFYRLWEDRLAFRGEWVRIGSGLNPPDDREGQLLGLAPGGGLLLRGRDGEEFVVLAGEVHLRPQ